MNSDVPGERKKELDAAKARRRGRASSLGLTVVSGKQLANESGADEAATAAYALDPPLVAPAGRNGIRSAAREQRAGRPAEMGEAAPDADGVRRTGSPSPIARAGTTGSPRTGPARQSTNGESGPQNGPPMPFHPLRRPVTADRPTDVGAITHAVAAGLADAARLLTPEQIAERVIAAAGRMVVNKVASRRRAVWFEAAGHASLYLRCAVPPLPWRLLGAEHPTGAGPVDLAWEHPDLGVVYDELKTTGHGGVTDPGEEYVAQAARYAAAGAREHGDRFLGVRLIVLGGLRASRLVLPDGAALPLDSRDPAGRFPLGHDGRSTR